MCNIKPYNDAKTGMRVKDAAVFAPYGKKPTTENNKSDRLPKRKFNAFLCFVSFSFHHFFTLAQFKCVYMG